MTLTARFDSEQIDSSSVDLLFEHVDYLLGEMVRHPAAALGDLALADAVNLVASPYRSSGFAGDLSLNSDRSAGDERLLANRLDGLSDEEVDALLATLAGDGGATHR